jgi:ubiquitin-protein ligase
LSHFQEWQEICRDPPPLCTAGPIGDNFHEWLASVFGSKDTPYEGGIFKILITFPEDYPGFFGSLNFRKFADINIYCKNHISLILLQKWLNYAPKF